MQYVICPFDAPPVPEMPANRFKLYSEYSTPSIEYLVCTVQYLCTSYEHKLAMCFISMLQVIHQYQVPGTSTPPNEYVKIHRTRIHTMTHKYLYCVYA